MENHPVGTGHAGVAVKVLRSTGIAKRDQLTKRVKEIKRELAVWQSLEHENIVPFIGIAIISGCLLSVVSGWMPQGTLRAFLMENQEHLRDKLAADIARGFVPS